MVWAVPLAAAAVSAAGSVFGGNKAANAQKDAAANATGAQMAMFNKTQNNLSPYMKAGTDVLPQLSNMATTGFKFDPTMAQLEQTPGYKFNLMQGQNAVQNSAAARGLARSGNALRGAADYASGLAANTYQQQFGNALTTYQNNFQNLESLASIGQNAAAGVGNAAVQTGNSVGSNMIGAGNAQAGAYMNAGNAFGSALTNYQNYALANKLVDQGNYYGSSSGGNSPWLNPDTNQFVS